MGVSWSAQTFRQEGDTPSGPEHQQGPFMTLPGLALHWGPTLEPGLGLGLAGERLVARGPVQCGLGSSHGGGPRRPNPWTKTLAIGTHGMSPRWGGRSLSSCGRLKRYRLEIVGLTSTHSLGSGTQLLERAGPSTTLELPRDDAAALVWACLQLPSSAASSEREGRFPAPSGWG
ncbi:hypothetical protein L3Q82_001044 [Scortum barcoo]|uniref:Uncharacterized protein n=1 Tax=Scortum barcoo TaxID=214431 RepID=A0ACB8WAI4_9TELE|nr:hypothetical protein L3Q82_001044 [Scortum barcoo]